MKTKTTKRNNNKDPTIIFQILKRLVLWDILLVDNTFIDGLYCHQIHSFGEETTTMSMTMTMTMTMIMVTMMVMITVMMMMMMMMIMMMIVTVLVLVAMATPI